MDGTSQAGYVLAVLKMTHNVSGTGRMAIIFRNGKQKTIKVDTGCLVDNIRAPNRIITYKFGSMTGELEEGQCYSRSHLYMCGAHANDRRGVAGSMRVGCPSIVMSTISSERGNVDQFRYLTYWAGARQRPNALFHSFVER